MTTSPASRPTLPLLLSAFAQLWQTNTARVVRTIPRNLTANIATSPDNESVIANRSGDGIHVVARWQPSGIDDVISMPGIAIYTTYSLALWRDASEFASLRGAVRWGNLPDSSDIWPHIPSPRWGSTLPEESESLVSELCRDNCMRGVGDCGPFRPNYCSAGTRLSDGTPCRY
jgi:hypothetical protein